MVSNDTDMMKSDAIEMKDKIKMQTQQLQSLLKIKEQELCDSLDERIAKHEREKTDFDSDVKEKKDKIDATLKMIAAALTKPQYILAKGLRYLSMKLEQ